MWFFVYYFTFIDNYNKIYDLLILRNLKLLIITIL